MDQNVRKIYSRNDDKKEQIEFLLEQIKEALEKPGSYYEFAKTTPWNLDERRSMAVDITRLMIYNERPVVELQPPSGKEK